jgi:hemerythrin-like domain-containing protein
MDISELMEVMNTVEEDHRQVLEKLQALQEGLGGLTGTARSRQLALLRLSEVNDLLANRFAEHALEEETALFPFLARNLPDEPDLVDSLRQEHEEIAGKREEFGDCLAMAQELGHGLTREIIASGWELLDLLDRHAQRETQAVQKCFARYLQTVPGM